MQLIIDNLKVPFENDRVGDYLIQAAKKLRLPVDQIHFNKILSKQLDIRDQQQFYYKLIIAVTVPANYANHKKFTRYINPKPFQPYKTASSKQPIIVGFGPAGMFAALELIEHGIRPIILERGKPIEQRIQDVSAFIKTRKLNTESNIQFGEGGAGSFSDGKLFSRRNNNITPVSKVLDTFVKFGAPEEISYIAKPHLGTDLLCHIVKNIRSHILNNGGEIHYNAKLTDFIIKKNAVCGVVVNNSREYISSEFYLATGHSARGVYSLLHSHSIPLEQRQISAGFRIEHPRELIDLFRYGKKYHKHPALGAATYSLNYTNKQKKRGVYTFCQCPGGEVLNASSHEGHLVVNGMSYSHRSSPFSNAAMAVTCKPEDFSTGHPLAGIAFQKKIEQHSFSAGGANYHAPAQNLIDFMLNKPTLAIKPTSYQMGLVPCDLRALMPGKITGLLLEAFHSWQQQYPMFITKEATLIAAETRTSSPVRILRNKNYESIGVKNLFPIGEGAGYTGGITSSAADGISAVTTHINSKLYG